MERYRNIERQETLLEEMGKLGRVWFLNSGEETLGGAVRVPVERLINNLGERNRLRCAVFSIGMPDSGKTTWSRYIRRYMEQELEGRAAHVYYSWEMAEDETERERIKTRFEPDDVSFLWDTGKHMEKEIARLLNSPERQMALLIEKPGGTEIKEGNRWIIRRPYAQRMIENLERREGEFSNLGIMKIDISKIAYVGGPWMEFWSFYRLALQKIFVDYQAGIYTEAEARELALRMAMLVGNEPMVNIYDLGIQQQGASVETRDLIRLQADKVIGRAMRKGLNVPLFVRQIVTGERVTNPKKRVDREWFERLWEESGEVAGYLRPNVTQSNIMRQVCKNLVQAKIFEGQFGGGFSGGIFFNDPIPKIEDKEGVRNMIREITKMNGLPIVRNTDQGGGM